MALLVAQPGMLCDQLVGALAEGGREVARIGPDHDDPFGAAAGHEAVVYIPSPRLAEPSVPSAPERMRVALAAARAPGVEVLVAVLPRDGFDEELDLLAQEGVPYVVLRAPATFEELGASLEGRRWLFVSKAATICAIEGDALVRAIDEAIETEEQGRTRVLGQEQPAKRALERAAACADREIVVVALAPRLLTVVTWLRRLFQRTKPPLALPAGNPMTSEAT